jgi:hypothetical protein
MIPRNTTKPKARRRVDLERLKMADGKRRATALALHNSREVQMSRRLLAVHTDQLRKLSAA